jgi:hypothetical protein
MADDESWRVPSIVQELAATVPEPPSRYLRLIPEQDRRADQLAGAEMPDPVPTIDLQRLLASDSADEEATKLRSALLSWGFFLVSGETTSSVLELLRVSFTSWMGWSSCPSFCPGY